MLRLVFILFLTISSSIVAQQSVVKVSNEGNEINLSDKISFYVDSSQNELANEILQKISDQGISFDHTTTGLLFDADRSHFWGSLTVKNTEEITNSQLLQIENTYLDHVLIYEVTNNDSCILIGKSGDHIRFSERSTLHKEHLFELNFLPFEQKQILFMFERKGKNIIKFRLLPTTRFIESDPNDQLTFGIYLGTILLFAFYAFGTFFFIKKPVFLYYALYIITCGFSLSNVHGISFRYIYPNAQEYTDYFVTITAFLSVVFFFLFTIQFLELKQRKPKWYRFFVMYMLGYFATAIICILIYAYNDNFPVLPIHYTLLIISILLLLASAVISINDNRKSSLYFLISFSPILFGSVVQIMMESGVIGINYITKYILLYSSFLEILIISIGISMKLREDNLQRALLSEQVANNEKELNRQLIEVADREKRNISLSLHDTIGVKLRLLKSLVESSRNKEAAQEIEQIGIEIRDLSHYMAPTVLDLISIQEAIKDLSIKLKSDKLKITVHVLDFPEDLDKSLKVALYNAISELINNSIKHGKPSVISVQFNKTDNNLIVSIEDNGDGFNQETATYGLGIQSIHFRISKLNGEFSIESSTSHGTIAIIQLPL